MIIDSCAVQILRYMSIIFPRHLNPPASHHPMELSPNLYTSPQGVFSKSLRLLLHVPKLMVAQFTCLTASHLIYVKYKVTYPPPLKLGNAAHPSALLEEEHLAY